MVYFSLKYTQIRSNRSFGTNIIDISKKVAFVLGSEDIGIRDLVKKKCDDLIKIEINKSSNSLNVSNACSACLAITNYKLNENNNFK